MRLILLLVLVCGKAMSERRALQKMERERKKQEKNKIRFMFLSISTSVISNADAEGKTDTNVYLIYNRIEGSD